VSENVIFSELIACGRIQRLTVGIHGGLDVGGEIGVRHRRIAEFLLVRFRNSDTLAQLASRALRRSYVCHAYRLDLLRAPVRLACGGSMWLGPNLLQFDLTAQMGSNHFIASTRSFPKVGCFERRGIRLSLCRNLRGNFVTWVVT
jgi:hypothetical protein